MRCQLPIHLSGLNISVPPGIHTVWRTGDLDTKGNNLVNAFMALQVVNDSLPGVNLQLTFDLLVAFNTVGAVATTVIALPQGQAQALRNIPALIADRGLAQSAHVRLVSNSGGQALRALEVHIDGVIVAGTPTERAAGRR